MSKLFVAACAIALAATNVSWGTEPYQQFGYGMAYDAYSAPTPSGLRFAGLDTTIRTGGPSGDPGAGVGCNNCGGGTGVCIDWKLYGWYGSWEGHHHGYGNGAGGGRGCGYGCRRLLRSCETCNCE